MTPESDFGWHITAALLRVFFIFSLFTDSLPFCFIFTVLLAGKPIILYDKNRDNLLGLSLSQTKYF